MQQSENEGAYEEDLRKDFATTLQRRGYVVPNPLADPHPYARILRSQVNAGEELPLCINVAKQFRAKEAFVYIENIENPLRAFKPRRVLTETHNGRPCTENVAEEYVWFDWHLYKQKQKIRILPSAHNTDLDINYDSFEQLTGFKPNIEDEQAIKKRKVEKGLKGKPPEKGEELTLVNLNINDVDLTSVRKFMGTVVDVRFGKARINWFNLNISKDPHNKNFGTVLLHIDTSQYFLQRSIVFPPRVPKYVSLKMD